MDVLAWIWWLIVSALSLVWTLFWFLISGWVSTLLQIALLVGVVFYFKYGWQRAPVEIWKRATQAARFVLGWVRTREPATNEPRVEVREVVRVVRIKERGDVNLSTMLSLAVLAGLALMAG